MPKRLNGGYVGILMLLVSVVIISLIVWRTDLVGGKSGTDNKDQNMIESGRSAVDSAEEARMMLESKNQVEY